MMNSEKRVFAILGGIFLMVAGFFSFLPAVASFISGLRHSFPLRPFLLLSIAILLLLGGLFLLLRKPRVTAIMMCAVTVSYVVYYAALSRALFAPAVLCLLLSCALFAAGLFGRGVYGLIMCLAAAFFRLIPYGNSLKSLPQLLSNGGLSSFGAVSTQFASLLTIAGMVMAGLYLFSLRKKA